MLKKSFKKTVGICLATLMAFSTLTAFGAGYGSLALEKTSVNADLFNGTGSFETGVKEVGATGDSNLSTGWKVFRGGATTANYIVVKTDKVKDGDYAYYGNDYGKYISPDDGVVKHILDTCGFNGKYVLNAQLISTTWASTINAQFRLGTVKILDTTKLDDSKFVPDAGQWVSGGSKVYSPTSPEAINSRNIKEEELAALKPQIGSSFIVLNNGSFKDTKHQTATNSFTMTFDGTDPTTWQLWYSYNGYGYRDGKFWDNAGNSYDTYAVAKEMAPEKTIRFNDTYAVTAADALSPITTSDDVGTTDLMINGSAGAYIDGITLTFEPAGDKASDFKGSTMPVDTKVYNNFAEQTDAVLITAIYDADNTLKGVSAKNFTIGANETDKIVSDTIDVPSDLGDGYSVKTYAWKNLENDISPLATALDREANDGNLLENGGFEIFPKTTTGSTGDDSIAKNWKFWGGYANNDYVAQAGGASGSAYCVKSEKTNTYFEYTTAKMTEILKDKGVKGTYTLSFDYKAGSASDIDVIFRINTRGWQQVPKFRTNADNDWHRCSVEMKSNGYVVWDGIQNKSVPVNMAELDETKLSGRLGIKLPMDVQIDNISLTFTPDTTTAD